MNQQFEFMNDVLHVLAQPVTALRAALELGLRDHANRPAVHKTFEDCLGLVDRLTQELAIYREIASLQPEPALELCDGEALLKNSLEEMAPVAEACGVALHLKLARTGIECNGAMLQRAIFLLLDELIACSPSGGISIELTRNANEARFELRPGIVPSRRQPLYRKLIELAGGRSVCFEADRTSCCFRNGELQQVRNEAAAN